MNIVNLTQHTPSKEQVAAGVVQPCDVEAIKSLLNVDGVLNHEELSSRARHIVELAGGNPDTTYMVGGHFALTFAIVNRIKQLGGTAVTAFSKRVSTEDPETGVKTSVFKHMGFQPIN